MELNEKYQAAKIYADLTLDLLSKHNVPPTPINYSVFYLYANGTNEFLNDDIKSRLAEKSDFDDVFMENLFCQYISNADQINNAVLGPLNESIGHLLTKIDEQVSLDEETVNNLTKVDKALSKVKPHGSLQKLMSYILNSLSRSKVQHQSLSKELSHAQNEMRELKKQLEASRKEAILDVLTGLLNRRGGDEKLKELDIEEVHTSMAIDIDHFKSVNDNFGHFIGDRVIQRVAKSIQEHISEQDLAIRAGGEEFIVVMANKTLKEAQIVADKIRETIANLKLKQKNSNKFLPKISVSIGVAETKGEQHWKEVFERADKALYEAKSSGRNCTKIAA